LLLSNSSAFSYRLRTVLAVVAASAAFAPSFVQANCPFATKAAVGGRGSVDSSIKNNPYGRLDGDVEPQRYLVRNLARTRRSLAEDTELSYSNQRVGDGGIPDGGYAAVTEDLKTALVTSLDFFPADFEPPTGPNYGGLMIRLAWHCNG